MTRMKTAGVNMKTVRSATELPNDYIAQEMLSVHRFSFNIAVLHIEGTMDTSVPSVHLTASVLGATIGRLTLDPSNPSARIGGSIAGFKAFLEVSLQTNPAKLVFEGEIGVPFGDSQHFRKEISI